MKSPQDTIAAIATPVGEGGLGIVRVSGLSAISIVDHFFEGAPLDRAATHTCHFGRLRGETVIDQAVVTLFRAPQSYTGEDVVEIATHGSPFILENILRLCAQQGARLAEPGEFTQRAFLNGKMDLTQAEAVVELIHAKTEKAHAAAYAQLEGQLSRRVRELRDRLLPLLAHVEVGLDHSDEDHDFLARQTLMTECAAVQQALEAVLASEAIGKILRHGLRVTLVGRPNVGKSSLLNALLKEERAIVTPVPGTTRDTLEENLNLDGVPVVLTDTAGLRQRTNDAIERLGMDRTRQALEATDLVLGLFDSSAPLTDEDQSIITTTGARPHLWVASKCDLPLAWPDQALSRMNGGAAILRVSVKTGEGLLGLARAMKRCLLTTTASTADAQWMLNARHREALARARHALEQATRAAQDQALEECVALELKTALDALGEIIGETTTDDLLGQIFSKFCIGK